MREAGFVVPQNLSRMTVRELAGAQEGVAAKKQPAEEIHNRPPVDGIEHREQENRFVHVFNDGSEAEVSYVFLDEKTVDFVHTFVPPQWRGRTSMSSEIPARAFAWAASKGLQIKRSCWYLNDVIGPQLSKTYGHLYV